MHLRRLFTSWFVNCTCLSIHSSMPQGDAPLAELSNTLCNDCSRLSLSTVLVYQYTVRCSKEMLPWPIGLMYHAPMVHVLVIIAP